ncbi:MAG: VOC family protein [Actinomycetota bacterium]
MRFGYAIVYVPDVVATLDFYERAFGMTRGYVAQPPTYGELDTGTTRLAFVSHQQAESLFPGGYRPANVAEQPPGVEIAFVTDDVDAAYARALGAGAIAVAAPDDKPWGQRIAYVRDDNGVLVELCTSTRD